MSRNLGDTDCKICGTNTVACDGPPHAITQEETGDHLFVEYQGLIVATAHCTDCNALYLAWCDDRDRTKMRIAPQHARWNPDRTFFDLSFRHSFNDEPNTLDLPTPEKLQEIHRRQYISAADRERRTSERALGRAKEYESAAEHGVSEWEIFRKP